MLLSLFPLLCFNYSLKVSVIPLCFVLLGYGGILPSLLRQLDRIKATLIHHCKPQCDKPALSQCEVYVSQDQLSHMGSVPKKSLALLTIRRTFLVKTLQIRKLVLKAQFANHLRSA